MNLTRFLLSISGRFNRAKWWTVQSVVGVIAVLVMAIDASGVILPQGLFILAIMGAVVAVATSGIKRLHDRDKSGWWLLLFYVVPEILHELVGSVRSEGMGLALEGLAMAILACGVIEIGGLRGTPGVNRYGSDPLDHNGSSVQVTQ
jgi:uncharacterized membrane protein YhaH (DUF805 family)